MAANTVRCHWCESLVPLFKLKEHGDLCIVKQAVKNAERQAGRPLRFNEARAVRDRAREAMKEAR